MALKSDHNVGRQIKFLCQFDVDRLYGWPKNAFDCILDLGANTGIFSLAASFVYPHARVVAVEADTNTYNDILVPNVADFGIDCVNAAYGVRDSQMFLNREGRSDAHNFTTNNTGKFSVPGMSLKQIYDTHCKNAARMFIKIDVETTEQVLLDQPEDWEIIKNYSLQTTIELHLPPKFRNVTKTAQDWFARLKEHNLPYVYKEMTHRGHANLYIYPTNKKGG
jgi:FkbM family methyltransferase